MACGATPDEMLAIHNELSRQRSMKLMEHGILDAEHCTQCVESDFRIMAALSAGMVVAGCLCQIPHELMNSRDKGCGDLVSLVEYIAGVSLSAPSAFRNTFRVKLHHHALLATLGLAYAFFTNLSLASNLPTSVFVALKNGTLATNLVVGAVVL